jgi:hypothetical protein
LTILALAITATLMVILDFGMSMACKELANEIMMVLPTVGIREAGW